MSAWYDTLRCSHIKQFIPLPDTIHMPAALKAFTELKRSCFIPEAKDSKCLCGCTFLSNLLFIWQQSGCFVKTLVKNYARHRYIFLTSTFTDNDVCLNQSHYGVKQHENCSLHQQATVVKKFDIVERGPVHRQTALTWQTEYQT